MKPSQRARLWRGWREAIDAVLRGSWLALTAHAALREVSRQYRSRVLHRTTFVVVTGSCGKTTTKELIAAVLASRFRGSKSRSNRNTPWNVPRHILRVRPADEFCVMEIAGAGKDLAPLDELMLLIQPRISVVTNVESDHYSLFRHPGAVAEHKGKIVDALRENGVAVLNADDPRVLGMRRRCRGRVVTYGLSDAAMMRASDVVCAWPDRLSFVATCGEESIRVQTQLCARHSVSSVLAALAVGHVMGVPLSAAALAIEQVQPIQGRMSPVETADGITFVLDARKTPLWTIPASLDFLRAARAKRKILVMGSFSDYGGTRRHKCRAVAQGALDVVDAMIGVGPMATSYLRAVPRAGQTVKGFSDTKQARVFLHEFLESGDLVLVKGSKVDRLAAIVEEWTPRGATPTLTAGGRAAALPNVDRARPSSADLQLIVGLGNSGTRFEHTPHNVGYEAVDALASLLGVTWGRDGDAMVADALANGRRLELVKLGVAVNHSGAALHALALRLNVPVERCVVVFDDVALPLGTVRDRPWGSAGGHKGLESILLAFQSHKVRRVKIGVGRPIDGDVAAFVIRPFTEEQQTEIARACQRAAQQILRGAAPDRSPRRQRAPAS